MKRLPLDDLSDTIARIRGLLLTEEKASHAVALMARAIKETLPGHPEAGVSILDAGGNRISSAATHPLVEQLDAVQYELDEGPCLTAWSAEEVVLVEDVHTDQRWPNWRAAVLDTAVRSVASAPLMAGGQALGALNIYSALPGQYDGSTGRVLPLFAGTAATLLAHVQGTEVPLRMAGHLKATLATRDTINRACGMLMERHGIGHDDALGRLITQARKSGGTLAEVSALLVAGAAAPGNNGG